MITSGALSRLVSLIPFFVAGPRRMVAWPRCAVPPRPLLSLSLFSQSFLAGLLKKRKKAKLSAAAGGASPVVATPTAPITIA